MNKPNRILGFSDLSTAILVAALMITVAIIYASGKDVVQPVPATVKDTVIGQSNNTLLSGSDYYLRGNPNAPVKIIEFSDLECPFCKRFQLTMQQVMDNYGDQVAWIYKHFPLDNIHPKTRAEANAAECAGEQGGDKAFWDYIDRIFAITPSNNGLDLEELPRIAKSMGLDQNKFEQCLVADKYAKKIEAQYQEGLEAGVLGTPHTIVLAPNGQKGIINGAQSYSEVKRVIDAALKLKK